MTNENYQCQYCGREFEDDGLGRRYHEEGCLNNPHKRLKRDDPEFEDIGGKSVLDNLLQVEEEIEL